MVLVRHPRAVVGICKPSSYFVDWLNPGYFSYQLNFTTFSMIEMFYWAVVDGGRAVGKGERVLNETWS